ncbi:SMEK domain-containing protein [Cohnella sp.]|uniref:SMEK domain-containing protein n=1 Tax=Cohnella sp. TaxID=1883426 RepID=UPI003562F306
MINKQKEDMRIIDLIVTWVVKIKINNYSAYFDINTASEGLALKLLNLVYDYKLVDLNKEAMNYPGIDLGDRTKSGLAVQVTSRSDNSKIRDTLQMFYEKKYINDFPNGLKMFILTTDTINLNRKTKAPYNLFFNYKEGIITPSSIMRDISNCSDKKRAEILTLLEHELGQTDYFEKKMHEVFERVIKKSDSENNLKVLGHLLTERTKRRIDKFIDLEAGSWQYGYIDLNQDLISKFESLHSLEDDYKSRLYQVLEKIEDGSVLKLLFEEYMELEKNHFSILLNLFFTNQFAILISTGMSFQSLLRSMLDSLIDKHNENMSILSTYFDIKLEKIENNYKDINEIIWFKGTTDKRLKLERLVNELEKSTSRMYVFFDSGENLDVLINSIPVIKLNGDKISMPDTVRMLAWDLETVSYKGEVFGASINPDDVIFLTPTDNETKREIALLQKRSFFRVYYFEDQS